MSRVILPITMELRSDAVFGSGFSVPGGEDVAVCQDEQGYPYMKGATLKGLLRESLENLTAWTGTGEEDITALMGQEGWPGTADERRIRFTALTLNDPPQDPEDCFDSRTFTSLENGIVKQGTLHTAACVRRGLAFSGQLQCEEGDVPLLQDGLAGIKWAGTMRSRGFGSIRIRTGAPERLSTGKPVEASRCIHYRLHSELPVIITDLGRSSGNSYETQGFIPGAAVRGVVMSSLSAQDPTWFEAHKKELLSVRFLDAMPMTGKGIPLPSVKGFYGEKGSDALEYNVVTGAEVKPGHKRAGLGSFCTLDGETVRYWSAKTGGTLRIQRGREGKDTAPFQVRYLEAGQDFEGYILLKDPELASQVSKALGGVIWLGADRYAGFGKCSVTLTAADQPAWLEQYGYQTQEEVGRDLYLFAVSPLTMLNGLGEPCGLDEKQLAQKLGVDWVEIRHCSTSMTQNSGYNRVWQSRTPALRMYDRGSLFHLECAQPPALERVRQVQVEGLGVRRAEGFGQVLFMPEVRLTGLRKKEEANAEQSQETRAVRARAGKVRRAKYQWVMDKVPELDRFKLSRSQLGTVQSLCEKAIANGGDCAELNEFLAHNENSRGVLHGDRFKEFNRFVLNVLETPLKKTLWKVEKDAVPCEDSQTVRLELLCLLFNHSRREGM